MFVFMLIVDNADIWLTVPWNSFRLCVTFLQGMSTLKSLSWTTPSFISCIQTEQEEVSFHVWFKLLRIWSQLCVYSKIPMISFTEIILCSHIALQLPLISRCYFTSVHHIIVFHKMLFFSFFCFVILYKD